jgi:tetratricopeptide (TPR) repeat protein
MRTPVALLKFIASAIANHYFGGYANDFFGSVLPEIASDVWDWWSKDSTEDQRRTELQSMLRIDEEELKQLVRAAVSEAIHEDQHDDIRQLIEAYLTEIPRALRKSLRTLADPKGETLTADLMPTSGATLLRMLPSGLPRFRVGALPLPGVDLKLEQLLGIGGFGEVWKARQTVLINSDPMALKFCLDNEAAKLLRNEARLLDRLMKECRHPGIVQLRRTYLDATVPFLEYEYVDGIDLGALIDNLRLDGGEHPFATVEVMLHLTEIVAFAHRLNPPIVHRDLKPSNILVQSLNGVQQFKITDFGIGEIAARSSIERSTGGTPATRTFFASVARGAHSPRYASPEQIRGERPDPRDDIFALGVIWYQMLVGDINSECPRGANWIKRLLSKGVDQQIIDCLANCIDDERENRYSDASVLESVLRGFLPPKVGPGFSSDDRENDEDIVEEILQLASSSAVAGDFHVAIRQYNRVIALDESKAQAYAGRGEVYSLLGDHAPALRDLTKAIRAEPDNSAYYTVRGMAFIRKGDRPSALSDLEQAIEIDPEFEPAYMERGRILLAQEDYDQAIDNFDAVLKLDPANSAAMVGKGNGLRGKKMYDLAIAQYNNAEKAGLLSVEVFGNRGQAHAFMRQYDEAIMDYDNAIKINDKIAEVNFLRADAVLRRGANAPEGLKTAEVLGAINGMTSAIRLGFATPEVYRRRGIAFLINGRFEDAVADFNRAISMAPNDAETLASRAHAYIRLGDISTAMVDCNRAIILNPAQLFAFVLRGHCYRAQGKFDAAFDELKHAADNTADTGIRTIVLHELRLAVQHDKRPFADVNSDGP